uniref:F-box domain-containing protein n=1 Tax=Timema douglasi TaxID=61478 RepID=A0A7R8ZB49_TIMDO|nr:unnamed protein product [Timema douglasi]
MGQSYLPEEIWFRVCLYLAAEDILSLGCTSKFFNKVIDNKYLWKKVWQKIVSKRKLVYEDDELLRDYDANFMLIFEDTELLRDYGVNFKSMCQRLNRVWKNIEPDVLSNPSKIRTSTPVKKLCPLIEFPKITSTEKVFIVNFGQKHVKLACPFAYNNYCIYTLSKPDTHLEPCVGTPQKKTPLCSFCDSVRSYCQLKSAHNYLDSSEWEQNPSGYASLSTELSLEMRELFRSLNLELVAPPKARQRGRTYLLAAQAPTHFFKKTNIQSHTQQRNSILLFCEPLYFPAESRRQLLHFFFRYCKVNGLWFVKKPIIYSDLNNVFYSSYIVVDSGAFSTTVAIVINNQVTPGMWQEVPVGGWHLAQHLKEAMAKDVKYPDNKKVPVFVLDSFVVKRECCLNPTGDKSVPAARKRRENMIVHMDSSCGRHISTWSLSLGRERVDATETMFAIMNLPQVIKELVEILPEEIMAACLGNIICTGDNARIKYFVPRLCYELERIFPSVTIRANILLKNSIPMASTFLVSLLSKVQVSAAYVAMGMKYALCSTSLHF